MPDKLIDVEWTDFLDEPTNINNAFDKLYLNELTRKIVFCPDMDPMLNRRLQKIFTTRDRFVFHSMHEGIILSKKFKHLRVKYFGYRPRRKKNVNKR